MSDLALYQYLLIAIVFVWSGFVRSGLGFGGSVLSLPFLLVIHNAPVVYLPIFAVHLLFFSTLTIVANNRGLTQPGAGTVDWRFLWRGMAVMVVPCLMGIFGLITLPADILSLIIFAVISVYALGYLFNRPLRSNSKTVDILFLMLGGYISGTSLIGSPLIMAVAGQSVARERLRDTMLAMWFILVVIKMSAFIYAGVDLQLIHHLWLLPCAAVGHVVGLRFHDHLLKAETPRFFRFMGAALLTVSVVGLVSSLVD